MKKFATQYVQTTTALHLQRTQQISTMLAKLTNVGQKVSLIHNNIRTIRKFSFRSFKKVKTYHAINCVWIKFLPIFLSNCQSDFNSNRLFSDIIIFENDLIFWIEGPGSLK